MGIPLRTKILLFFALALLSLFGLQYGAARMVMLEQFAILEQEKAEAALERIKSLFIDNSEQLLSSTSDWAAWDDTYTYAGGHNPTYIATNYTASTLPRLKIDGILVVDDQQRVLHIQDRSEEKPPILTPALQAWLLAKMARMEQTDTGIRGFVTLPQGLYMVAIHPILTSEGQGPGRGFLAMVRDMDRDFVTNLAKVVHYPLELFPANLPLPDGDLAPQQGRQLITHQNQTIGYLLLQDIDQQPSLVVRTILDRKIYEQGESSLHMLLFSTGLILLSLLGFSLFFDRTVLKPVARLNHEIHHIDADARQPMQVTPLAGAGELSDLVAGVNAMLARLTQTMQALRQSRESLRVAAMVLEKSNDLILITDASNRIISVNQGFCRISGYQPEEVIGQNPRMLRSHHHDPEFYSKMWFALLRDGYWQGEIWNRRKTGDAFPEWLAISVVRNDAGDVENFVAIGADLTERKEADRRIAQMANYDSLTQLPNRHLLRDRLEQATLNARTYNRMAGVLVLGLDRFKHLNDSLGHAHGDTILRQVTHRLSEVVARDTTVARIGGDTFAIVLTHFHDPSVASRLANVVLETIGQPFQVAGHEVVLTTSVGISIFPADGDSADDLVRHGEQAMFRAKEQGRNTYAFFENQMQEAARERFTLENHLRRAMENQELLLHYQPQFHAHTHQLVGAEALIRWRHPQLGMVSPGRFIPVAEESGLVVPIGNWVLATVCRQIKTWQTMNLPVVTVAVNVSALQFRQPGFVDLIRQTIEQAGIEPHLLELEVTESLLIQDVDTTVNLLKQIKGLGLKMAIDDFGTGYSSLHYLNRFPLDKLKVDQSFVRGLPDYQDNAVIARAIIQLARSLGLRVIAEGVETREQLAFLAAENCDEIQGYLFDRPLPAEEFAKRLSQHGLPA